jgi:hypothetical protein
MGGMVSTTEEKLRELAVGREAGVRVLDENERISE